tara:strand:- start:6 stop:656 length:651 start_codon:yes stop_codon:yes gene_type:complete
MKNELFKRILSSIILLPIVIFFIIKGSFLFNSLILICSIITLYEWQLMSKGKNYNIFGFIYIIASFYIIYLLRNHSDDQYLFFLLILIICISTDIGGYVFGKVFKGPKLTKISPNKTYAGMIGAFLLSILTATFFLNYYDYYLIDRFEILNIYNYIFIIFISFVSQFGDILISFFKRRSKIKNSGKIIPGHGGLLDRIDGMIFAFPASYLIFKIIN